MWCSMHHFLTLSPLLRHSTICALHCSSFAWCFNSCEPNVYTPRYENSREVLRLPENSISHPVMLFKSVSTFDGYVFQVLAVNKRQERHITAPVLYLLACVGSAPAAVCFGVAAHGWISFWVNPRPTDRLCRACLSP